ncbi:trichothecene 3-O-acetyltransferase [Microdochium nivale]|nr:trichothecene 3-O-acetyltransferase [Microdochium nivale]
MSETLRRRPLGGRTPFRNNNNNSMDPGDENAVYYPLSAYDGMPAHAGSSPVVLMRFDDVLDSGRLRDALVRLLEMGDWRKLGGRFVRDPVARGRFLVRIIPCPARSGPGSTASGPSSLRFSHVQHEVRIAEHPLGSQLPAVKPRLELQPGPGYFVDFCYEAGAPASVDDYIRADAAPLGLRVTSFLDATLVAVTWSHALMDGIAFQRMMEAWCLVLAGREGEVTAVGSPFGDPLRTLWEDTSDHDEGGSMEDNNDDDGGAIARKQALAMIPAERYVWADKLLTGWRFVIFAIQMVWTMIWQSRVTNRTLVLPAAFMAELRDEAAQSLPGDTTFVSDGDIICAWFTRLLVHAHGWHGPVTQLNVVDVRGRVPGVFDKEAVYLSNMTCPAFTFLHARDLRSHDSQLSLGAVASLIRSSIASQITAAQVLAVFRLSMPSAVKSNRPPIFGEPTSRLAIVSNWAKARFILDTDFSPALVASSRKQQQLADDQGLLPARPPPGRMTYEFTGQVVQTAIIRDTAVIVGKDHAGNYWLSLYLAEAVVDAAGREVERAELARDRGEPQI